MLLYLPVDDEHTQILFGWYVTVVISVNAAKGFLGQTYDIFSLTDLNMALVPNKEQILFSVLLFIIQPCSS